MANNNEQSVRQIDRFLKKVVQKFPCDEENACLTDILIWISVRHAFSSSHGKMHVLQISISEYLPKVVT